MLTRCKKLKDRVDGGVTYMVKASAQVNFMIADDYNLA